MWNRGRVGHVVSVVTACGSGTLLGSDTHRSIPRLFLNNPFYPSNLFVQACEQQVVMDGSRTAMDVSISDSDEHARVSSLDETPDRNGQAGTMRIGWITALIIIVLGVGSCSSAAISKATCATSKAYTGPPIKSFLLTADDLPSGWAVFTSRSGGSFLPRSCRTDTPR